MKGCCPRPLDDRDFVLFGGGTRDRTADLLHAMQALSQLSYTPTAYCKTTSPRHLANASYALILASPRGFEPRFTP
ncbi:protein of unknown function [Denitratisoma oestradiolicum]|uniref:Uncharacterized protein n=1 Tax=Denitratisoma oestradiolicum TaxID=311182 RepID=A0A6S6Y0S0_9PROT|nr:protein of unknown function [Denitratisoma oestradiolicum]